MTAKITYPRPDKPFPWREPAEDAVPLLAEGLVCHERIARHVGVSRMTLWRWERHPEFRDFVRLNRRTYFEPLIALEGASYWRRRRLETANLGRAVG